VCVCVCVRASVDLCKKFEVLRYCLRRRPSLLLTRFGFSIHHSHLGPLLCAQRYEVVDAVGRTTTSNVFVRIEMGAAHALNVTVALGCSQGPESLQRQVCVRFSVCVCVCVDVCVCVCVACVYV
jgi:hypothetical protein